MKILHYLYYKRLRGPKIVHGMGLKAKGGQMMSSEVILRKGMTTRTWTKALIKARTLNLTHVRKLTKFVIDWSKTNIFSIEE